VRVGYYVNNEYDSEELNADPPAKPLLDRVKRNVLAEKPRVTRFAIKWDSDASAPAEFPPDQPEADLVADGEEYGVEEAGEEEDEEVEGEEGAAADPDAMQHDSEMAGAEVEGAAAEESGDESEDLEAESSGESDEEGEEEDVDGDDDMEMDGVEKPINEKAADVTHQVDEVMAH